MTGHWLGGEADTEGGALWHGDGLAMVHALGRAGTPIGLFFASPPYGIPKASGQAMPLKEWIDWQRHVLQTCVTYLAPGGSVIWQVGTWVDRVRGAVYPLDMPIHGILDDLGLTPRNRIIWPVGHGLHATRRLSGRHESLVWFTKDRVDGSYVWDLDAIRVPQKFPGKRHYKGPRKGERSGNVLGKNCSDFWDDIAQVKANHRERTGHPCQMPLALAERAILMATRPGDLVADVFAGSCTTVVAALLHGRRAAGADLNATYLAMGQERLRQLAEGTLPRRPYRRALAD